MKVLLKILKIAVIGLGGFWTPVASARQLAVPAEYTSIADAVNAALPYDTVKLDSGTFGGPGFFDIQIHVPLHITSAYGRGTTIIDGVGAVVFWGLPQTDPDTSIYQWSVSGITIRNAFRAAWILNRHSQFQIVDCRLVGCETGIYVQPDIMVARLWVDSCMFDSNGTAIRIQDEIDADISHSVFVHNAIGLLCQLGCYPKVRDCTFRDHLGWAIRTDDGTIATIANNLFLNDSVAISREGYEQYFWTVSCNDIFGATLRYQGLPDQTGQNSNVSIEPRLCSTRYWDATVSSLSPLLSTNNECHLSIGFFTGIGCYCGDVDANGQGPDIGDLTRLIDFLFISFAPIVPKEAGEIDGDGGIDIGDLTELIDNLFVSGAPLPCGGSSILARKKLSVSIKPVGSRTLPAETRYERARNTKSALR